MNFLANKPSKQLAFVMVMGAFFLFVQFIQTLVLASFVAIMDPNTMRFSTYLLTLGESFVFYYYFHIPATGLLAVGIYGLIRK